MSIKTEVAEGKDKLLGDVLDVIRFTEGISAKLHRLLDEAKIYQVVKGEFAKSDRYTMGILLLADDGASLKVAEISMSPSKLKVLERVSGQQVKEFVLKLSKSSICRQVVREGKTVHTSIGDVIREILPRPLAYLISKTMGYDKQFSILTPIHKHGKATGVLAMYSTDLGEYFAPPVENLALHISNALELADEHAQRKRAVQALEKYHGHLGELVEERTVELKEEITERKEAEEALRKIEQEKSAILNSTSELMVYQDTEHRILWTNKAAAESVALSIEQLVGRRCYEVWHQSNKPCVGCPVAKACEIGKPQEAEMTTPDGRVWFVRGYPLRDADEKLVGVVEVALEITERKRAEEALRESREKFQKMFESVTDGISVVDLSGVIIETNQRAVEMHGFASRDELLGRSASELIAPRDRERIAANMRRAVKEGVVRGAEYTLLKADGTEFPGELSTSVLRDASGKVVAHITIARDITQRKRMEGALRESEERFRSIVENSQAGIMILDDAYRFVYVNDELGRISGHSRDELIGQDFRQFLDEESKELVAERYIQRQRGKEVPPRYEFNIIKKDGQKRRVEISSAVIKDSAGEVRTVAQLLDITERKRAAGALQSEKNKLQSLVDAMEDDLTIQDRDYNIIYQNEPSRISSGGDHVGEKCYRAYEGREKICEGCPVEKAFKDGKSHTAGRKTVAPSGEDIFWETTANPIRDASGEIVSCLEVGRNITERKRAEEAMADEATRRRILVDQSRDGIVVLDEDGKVYESNRRFAEMLGYSLEEARELHVWDWDTQWTREQLLEMVRSVDEVGDHFVTYHRRKDGTVIDVEISTNGAVCAGQKLVFCVCRDITERKRAEEELQAEKNKLQSLVDTMEDGLTIQDKDYNIIYQNEPLRKNYGERLGEKCYRVYEGREKICEGCPVEKAFKDGKSHTSERRVVMPSGEVAFGETTANPIRDAEGKIVSCLEVVRNITERKQAEEQLRESQKFSSSLLASSPNPISVVDLDTSIRYVNPAFEKLTGFTLAEIAGRKAPYPWWPEGKRERILAAFKDAVEHGGRRTERNFQKKNGERFWVALNSAPIMEGGKAVYLIINWLDITERKQAEEKEKQLQQELYLAQRLASVGELAAGVAHEINNPLTGVLGFSQRLMRKSVDEKVSHDLEVIHSEAQRAAEVVQSLLTFARRRQPKKEYTDINDIVNKTLELRAYALQTGNIKVVTTLAPRLPQIMVDFSQMQEVFLNIILNAEQAMGEARGKGKLTIKTSRIKDYVRISFADNGPGISPENLDKVFDPFFTSREEKGGTGLGLSACHGIVTEHGGRIYATSKAGKGATFFVELPLSPVKAAVGRKG